MNPLDQLHADVSHTIRDVLGRRAPQVLRSLEETVDPPMTLREQVEDVLATEFVSRDGLQPDWEPTPYGKRVDDAIGAFVKRFPIIRSHGEQ